MTAKFYQVCGMPEGVPPIFVTEEEFHALLKTNRIRIIANGERGEVLEALGRYHEKQRDHKLREEAREASKPEDKPERDEPVAGYHRASRT